MIDDLNQHGWRPLVEGRRIARLSVCASVTQSNWPPSGFAPPAKGVQQPQWDGMNIGNRDGLADAGKPRKRR